MSNKNGLALKTESEILAQIENDSYYKELEKYQHRTNTRKNYTKQVENYLHI